MGNGSGKEHKKKEKLPQVPKVVSRTYPPQPNKKSRSTLDGFAPHLNLAVGETSNTTNRKERPNKFGTGGYSTSFKVQQQLAELSLTDPESLKAQVKKLASQTSNNGRDGTASEPHSLSSKSVPATRKRGFFQGSLKRNKAIPTPATASPCEPSVTTGKPLTTSNSTSFLSLKRDKTSSSTKEKTSALLKEKTTSFIREKTSFKREKLSNSNIDLANSKPGPTSSLSTESDYMSSSASSIDVGKDSLRTNNSYSKDNSYSSGYTNGNFTDPDNIVGGYDSTVPKNPQTFKPRGRSMSDTTCSDGSRELSISEIQKAVESEKKKNRRFQELTKVLAERDNVIIDLMDLDFIRKVGEGAFSEVWEGYWNGVHVAIKKLKAMVDDQLFEERFVREVDNLRKGNNQNIVMFFGVCLRPACIITEFMAGGNLYDLLHKSGKRFSVPLVVKMAHDLAVGLLHLHSLTILHRDLTSLNILIDEMGNIKISDFGLSREKTQEGSMTMTLGGICNPRWRPPEITKNIGHYSEKVDVYSFALVVWEILTGELPFANLDGPQAAAQVAYTNLRPPIPTTCPSPLRDLIERCWADDPKARPDFSEIVEELKAIQFSNPMGFTSENLQS